MTSSPFDQPVTFTLRVLLDLGPISTSATVIVPAQEVANDPADPVIVELDFATVRLLAQDMNFLADLAGL